MVGKFEIMDGCPIKGIACNKGEVIPIRMYLKGFDLTPT